jgi:hypothetical protein
VRKKIRLFLNSNVLTGGTISSWRLDQAILLLCAARVCRLVLVDVVREEVEENLRIQGERRSSLDADKLVDQYHRLLKLTKPELVRYPDPSLVSSSRHLIRHEPDVAVLLSATASSPDWLLTHNTKHFSPAVAARTGLRISTPSDFFRTLSSYLG